jgi:hypothetical protein
VSLPLKFRDEVPDDIAVACRWYEERKEGLGQDLLQELQEVLQRITEGFGPAISTEAKPPASSEMAGPEFLRWFEYRIEQFPERPSMPGQFRHHSSRRALRARFPVVGQFEFSPALSLAREFSSPPSILALSRSFSARALWRD